MTYAASYPSPLGLLSMVSDGVSLTGLWFEEQHPFQRCLSGPTAANESLAIFQKTRRWLDIYFSGKNPDFTPETKVEGSLFFCTVIALLSSIPYGETVTYGEIAKEAASRLGKERISSQAVGQAVGRNPVFLIIPCHRVIGSSGRLVGYGGGIARKGMLLKLEGIVLDWAF